MIDSAVEHCRALDELGFTRYCVSLKDSDPQKVARATAAFMAMGKFDLAALRKAYAGE